MELLFLGDSITDCDHLFDQDQLGNGYVRMIAEQLGYNNLAHFTKQFRAIVGLSPGQFRASPHSDTNTPARVDMTQILSDALAYHYKTQQQYHEVRYIKSNKP